MSVVPGLMALMQTPSLASSYHSPSSLVDSSAPTASSPPFCSFTPVVGVVSLPLRRASQRWPPAAAPPLLRDGAYR